MADILPDPLRAKALLLLHRAVLDLFEQDFRFEDSAEKAAVAMGSALGFRPRRQQYLIDKRTCNLFGRYLESLFIRYRLVRESLPYRLELLHENLRGYAPAVRT